MKVVSKKHKKARPVAERLGRSPLAIAVASLCLGLAPSAPTQTFSTLSEGQTIVGGAGLNVIRITGDVTLKTSLNITGSASSTFVFQLTSSTADGHDVLTLSGMTMNLSGGVLADSILW